LRYGGLVLVMLGLALLGREAAAAMARQGGARA